MKQQQHDINFEEDSEKKNSSPRWEKKTYLLKLAFNIS